MLKTLTIIAAGAALLSNGLWAQEDRPDHRLQTAAEVFHDMMSAPDRGIPRDLLEKAQCVVIVPGLKKAAFIVGGDYGKGYAVCRHDGGWTGPASITVGGGSFGAQIGVESTDLILLVMHRRGLDALLHDKFEIGGNISAAAGPVGRQVAAETNITMKAEILAWARAHGVYAGVSVNGMVVKKDGGEDVKLYGHEESNRAILSGRVPAPAVASILTNELDHFPKERS